MTYEIRNSNKNSKIKFLSQSNDIAKICMQLKIKFRIVTAMGFRTQVYKLKSTLALNGE